MVISVTRSPSASRHTRRWPVRANVCVPSSRSLAPRVRVRDVVHAEPAVRRPGSKAAVKRHRAERDDETKPPSAPCSPRPLDQLARRTVVLPPPGPDRLGRLPCDGREVFLEVALVETPARHTVAAAQLDLAVRAATGPRAVCPEKRYRAWPTPLGPLLMPAQRPKAQGKAGLQLRPGHRLCAHPGPASAIRCVHPGPATSAAVPGPAGVRGNARPPR